MGSRQVCRWFQSRNRGSFGFKGTRRYTFAQESGFQSRNRGSFDFKKHYRFSLPSLQSLFPSRNREAFGFKDITKI